MTNWRERDLLNLELKNAQEKAALVVLDNYLQSNAYKKAEFEKLKLSLISKRELIEKLQKRNEEKETVIQRLRLKNFQMKKEFMRRRERILQFIMSRIWPFSDSLITIRLKLMDFSKIELDRVSSLPSLAFLEKFITSFVYFSKHIYSSVFSHI